MDARSIIQTPGSCMAPFSSRSARKPIQYCKREHGKPEYKIRSSTLTGRSGQRNSSILRCITQIGEMDWVWPERRRRGSDKEYHCHCLCRPVVICRRYRRPPSFLYLQPVLILWVTSICCWSAFTFTLCQTVSTIGSFFLAMVLFPDVQKKAQDEIDHIVGGNRLPSFGDKSSLPYISRIVLECLRWNPVTPLGVAHCLTEDDEYNGYRIPKGSTILPNIWYGGTILILSVHLTYSSGLCSMMNTCTQSLLNSILIVLKIKTPTSLLG